MAIWEYKVITSGKGGFASPALLEKFLNDLGREEWEILTFQTQPDNFLAFTGLARRSTQRDWTLQDAAAAAAKAEAEKLRAEFEAKFKAANQPAAEERAPSFLEEKVAPDDGFRKPVDTSHDDEPEAAEEEKDEWDKLVAAEEDELPTFFEAIKPHMRRNQRGPGMSVGVDYLAKKWDQTEEDLKGALVECGFVMPEDEDSKAEYLEYDGDLYWINVNRRGELWINTKEKPRPVFRAVKAQKIVIDEPEKKPQPERKPEPEPKGEATEKPETGERKPETPASEAGEGEGAPRDARSEPGQPGAPLPEGAALLAKIRPHMRRNRRGPGGSGSASFLSRALKCSEADLVAGFKALGLVVPASPNDKPVNIQFGNEIWWLNSDSRGGLWINGRDKRPNETIGGPSTEAERTGDQPGSGGDTSAGATIEPEPQPLHPATTTPVTDTAAPVAPVLTDTAGVSATPAPANVLAAVRLLLKETKTGGVAAKVERIAEELGKSVEDLTAALVGAGLKVPEKPREKPVFVEHAGEILWFNKNAKGELWVNAKASKYAEASGGESGNDTGAEEGVANGEKKPARRGRSRGKKEDKPDEPSAG